MTQSRIVVVAAVCALAMHLPSSAQNVDSAEMTGQPLQYMKDGKVHGCGLRIVAVRMLPGDQIEGQEISLNFYTNASALVKAVAYEPIPMASVSKVKPRSVPVQDAWIKASGHAAAIATTKSVPGDDGSSLLFGTDFDAALAVLMAQSRGDTLQMTVRRRGQTTERILSGPVQLDQKDSQQLGQCMAELLANAGDDKKR